MHLLCFTKNYIQIGFFLLIVVECSLRGYFFSTTWSDRFFHSFQVTFEARCSGSHPSGSSDSAGICPRLTWKRLIPTSGPTNTVVGPPLAVILVFEVLPIYDPGKRTARGGRKHFETIKLEEHNSQSLEGHPGGMPQWGCGCREHGPEALPLLGSKEGWGCSTVSPFLRKFTPEELGIN